MLDRFYSNNPLTETLYDEVSTVMLLWIFMDCGFSVVLELYCQPSNQRWIKGASIKFNIYIYLLY